MGVPMEYIGSLEVVRSYYNKEPGLSRKCVNTPFARIDLHSERIADGESGVPKRIDGIQVKNRG